MAKVVNLRTARKQRAHEAKRRVSASKTGTRDALSDEAAQIMSRLEGKRLNRTPKEAKDKDD